MPWFKVDDQLHSHKKAMRAGTQAMGLWLLAGSWSAGHLTDGFVPGYVVTRLDPADGDDLAKRLERADLWEAGTCDGDEGWWFKDWGEFNPTADEVEAKREAGRQRQERSRRHRAGDHSMCLPEHCEHVTTGDEPDTDADSHESVTRDKQRPDPARPDPTPVNQEPTLDGTADADTVEDDSPDFDTWWDAYRDVARGRPTGYGNRKPAERAWKALNRTQQTEALEAVPVYARLLALEDADRTNPYPAQHGSTWLNQRTFADVAQQLADRKAPTATARGTPSRTVDKSRYCGCGQRLDQHDDRICEKGAA